MIITTAFVSMPSFIMGSLLLIAFAINLKWFPANGASKNGLVLPVLTLSLYPMAYITRLRHLDSRRHFAIATHITYNKYLALFHL